MRFNEMPGSHTWDDKLQKLNIIPKLTYPNAAGVGCEERGKNANRKIGEPGKFAVTEIKGEVSIFDELVLANIVKYYRNWIEDTKNSILSMESWTILSKWS